MITLTNTEPPKATAYPPLRAVLFDNDGTLVDSERLCNLAIQQQFASYGVNLSLTDLLTNYRGGRLQHIFSQLCSTYQLVLPIDYETQYRARLQQLLLTDLKPHAGAAALLQSLRQHGMNLAVVSNGPQSKMRFTLDHCGLLHFFCDDHPVPPSMVGNQHYRLFSAYDHGLFKPDPALYISAARTLQLAPADCLVVEDSLPGVQAGLAAGIRTIFLNHYREPCPAGAYEILQLTDLQLRLRQLGWDD